MPISDEIIELAPVKKTKKVFIILFAALGVLAAVAVTFLVLYLLKPSVTEETTVVREVTMSNTELFATTDAGGHEVMYASIGEEYTVYANITVEKGASPNIQWEWPRDMLQLVKSTETETVENEQTLPAYFKFIPRAGYHNSTVTIKARSQSNVNKSDAVTFVIVNQGAEDLKITEYGISGSMTKVDNDELTKVLSFSVPFYTGTASASSNKAYTVRFTQFGKYDPTTGTYNKVSAVETESGMTNAVRVNAYKPETKETSDVIRIEQTRTGSFDFRALKAGSADIVLEANINNENDVLTKKISVTVESNATLGYADTVYFFNRPVVDGDFIKSIIDDRNNTQIDRTKLEAKLKADTMLKMSSTVSSGAELVLPYSPTVKYADIYKHILINPISIQYNKQANGGEGAFRDAWYRNVSVTSSNSRVLRTVKNSTEGTVELETLGLSGLSSSADKCDLTFADSKTGSIGASVTVPVRVVAPNDRASVTVAMGETKYTEDNGTVNVQTAPQGKFDMTLVYNITAPALEKPEVIAENMYINNAFTLGFTSAEMDVKFKNKTISLQSGKEYAFDTFKVEKLAGGNSKLTNYTVTAELTVELKHADDGTAPELRFLKSGITLPGLDKLELAWEKTVIFNVTAVASNADFVEDRIGLAYITKHDASHPENEVAGNYVRSGDKKSVSVYVQNASRGTLLDISTPTGIRNILDVNAAAYSVTVAANDVTRVFETASSGALNFAGNTQYNTNTVQASLRVSVRNVANDLIATLTVNIYVIDATVEFEQIAPATPVLYDKDVSSAYNTSNITVDPSKIDIKAVHMFNKTPMSYSYGNSEKPNINLYHGDEKNENNILYRYYDENDGNYKFKANKDEAQVLYIYNTHYTTLYPACDIYEYSLKKSTDFSRICVEFVIATRDEYVGKHNGRAFENTPVMRATFTRKADGVALFTDNDYRVNSPSRITAESNEADENFGILRYRVNQNLDRTINVSSVINADGREIIALGEGLNVASFENAYIRVPADFKVQNTADVISGKERCYYSVRFQSPTVGDVNNGEYRDVKGFELCYGVNKTADFIITVENAARIITDIGVFSDNKCNDELTALTFGKFINAADLYSRTIYVKLSYEAVASRHTMFESALLSLPTYLTLQTTDKRIETETSSNPDVRVYRIRSDPNNVKNSAFDSDIFTLVFDLADGAGNKVGASDNITVAQALSSDNKISKAVSVNVGTGLARITVTPREGESVTVDQNHVGAMSYSFFLTNASDGQSFTFDLAYEALADGKYSIAYDYASAAGLLVEYPTDVKGLIVARTAKNGRPVISVSIDTANTCVMRDKVLTFKFTDKANGADGNNVFTLNITVNVEMDVYDISFREDNGNVDAVYSVVTDKAHAETSVSVTPIYNGGDSDRAPRSIENVRIYIATYSAGNYVEYTGNELSLSKIGSAYSLAVRNTVKKSDDYYIVAEYKQNGKNITETRRITVSTSDHTLEFASVGNTVMPVSGAVTVLLDGNSLNFTLAARIKNDGEDGYAGKTISYGLYTDEACSTRATVASVNSAGQIVFDRNNVKNAGATGIVWYEATCTDSGVTGATPLKVKITYRVKVTGVALDAMSGVLNGKVFTLYYIDDDNYTYADLGRYIKPVSDLGVAIPVDDTTITLSAGSNVLCNGTEIIPTGVNEAGVKLNIVAEYGDSSFTDDTYTVIVRRFGGVGFVGATSGKIDIITANTVEVAASAVQCDGFDAVYTLNAPTGLKVTGNRTVSLDGATLGNYELTPQVVYTVASGSVMKRHGTLACTATYTLTVDCDYDADFELLHNGVKVDPSSGSDNKHIIGNDLTGYTVRVLNADHGDGAARYSFETTNGVVNVGDVSGTAATVTVDPNRSGEFTVTLVATVYGKEFTQSYKYYFAYGLNPQTSLSYKVGSGEFGVLSGTALDIDYSSDSDKKVIKYIVGGVDMSANVDLKVSGGLANESVVVKDNDNNCFYITVDAVDAVTLYFGGTVTVGTRVVYLPQKSVTLNAQKPTFAFKNTVANELAPLGTTTLETENTADNFGGEFSTVYSVVSGGDDVSLDPDTGVLTVNSSVTSDRTVRVRATVTVTSGVFASPDTYTVDKDITIRGVALPTLEWKSMPSTVGAGEAGKLEFGGKYGLSSSDSAYVGKVDFTVTASSDLADSEYSLANDELTVNTKAGGKITLTLGGTVKSSENIANKGETLVPVTFEITVLPELDARDISVPNAKGSIDLNGKYKDSFKPFTGSRAGQIQATDTYKVTSVALASDADTALFGTDGGNLVIKQNITSTTSVDITVTVVMTYGDYKGYELTGGVTVTVTVPTMSMSTAGWNSSSSTYNPISVPANTTGTVDRIEVVPAPGFTVTNNGGAAPTVTIDRAYNLYLTGASGSSKRHIIGYYVRLENGDVYYRTLTVTVPAQQIALLVEIDREEITTGSAITKELGSQFLLNVSAGAFDVKITNKSSLVSADNLSYTVNDRSAVFNADSVTTSPVTVTLDLDIEGINENTQFTFTVSVTQPQTGDAYNVDNTEFNIKLGDSGVKSSTWTHNGSSSFRYGYRVTVSVPAGRLSDIFSALSLSGYNAFDLDYSSDYITINNNHSYTTDTFTINMTFRTNVVKDTTFTVKYDVYDSQYRWASQRTITETYTVRVIDNVTVTLNNNAGGDAVTGGKDSVSVSYKGYYSGLPTDLTRKGYTFDGWFRSATDDTQKVENGNPMSDTIYSAHTLYAHWSLAEYRVSYEYGYSGAPTSGLPESHSVSYGMRYGTLGTLSDGIRTGYAFIGWYIGDTHITEQTIVDEPSDKQNIMLTAKWTPEVYTVKFGGGVTVADAKVEFGANLVLPTPEVNDGYEFNGWYLNSALTESVPSALNATVASKAVDGVIQLYAKVDKIVYNISFELNGGQWKDAPVSGVTAKVDEGYSRIPQNDAVQKDGCTFVGWYTGVTDGTVVTGETSYRVNYGTKLYARWTVNTYTVTLELGGGKIGDKNEYIVSNLPYGFVFDVHTLLTPTRDNYRFDGWFDGQSNVTSTSVTVNSNKTLTARWTAIYTVTYNFGYAVDDADYADCPEPVTVRYFNGDQYNSGSKMPSPTRTGYDFGGWYNAGAPVNATDEVSGSVALTAKWTVITYTVKFHGGPETISDETYIYGETYGEIVNGKDVAEPDGRTLIGWSTVDGDESKIVSSSDTVATDSEDRTINLYAVYSAATEEP